MSSEQLEAEQKAFAEMMANEFGIIDVEDMMRNGSARDQTRVMIAKKAWQAARSQPAADRAMLLNLMEQFDTQVNVCPRCGEEEDCDTMDMANELREYLRAASQPAAPRVVGDEAITRLKHAIEFNEGICSGNEASLKALGWIGLYGREVLAALQSIATAQQEPRAGNGEGFSLEFKYGFLAFGRSVPFNSNPYGCGTRESCQWDSGWQAARNDEVKAYEL